MEQHDEAEGLHGTYEQDDRGRSLEEGILQRKPE